MTLNGYVVLNSVFVPICLASDHANFKNNCVKMTKIDTFCQQRKSSAGTLVYGNIKFIIIIIIIYLPRVCKSNNNNSEQTVGKDSKATQDAIITAHKLRLLKRDIIYYLCGHSEDSLERQWGHVSRGSRRAAVTCILRS